MKYLLFIVFLISGSSAQAQLGFCSGSKGDPIFMETFGSGSGYGEAFAPGITTYTYVNRDPDDGQYTIADQIGAQIGGWYTYLPQTTISNGKALIVNAGFSAGQFYAKQISGLCEETTYEFSAFLMNIYDFTNGTCANRGIPVNVRFEIWDETDTVMLKRGDTGDIQSTGTAEWEQYALTFQSEPGQNSVILKMFNNGEGGCGNDLAIDDIMFRSCGDLTVIETAEGQEENIRFCETETPVNIELNAISDNSVYKQRFFQWQSSEDGNSWTDIPGAISSRYTIATLTESKSFRVKVAEAEANLSSSFCSSASESFSVKILEAPAAPMSNGDVVWCGNDENITLRVQVPEGIQVNWYDSENGGNLLMENAETFDPEIAGTYYAEAYYADRDNCTSTQRTPVNFLISEVPQVENEQLYLCDTSGLVLSAGLSGMSYNWNTGAETEEIEIFQPGSYSVEITNSNGCSAVKEIEVVSVPSAGIQEIRSDQNDIVVTATNPGNFEYSIGGSNYQTENVFENVRGGIYQIFIRDVAGCNIAQQRFVHLVIPKFITPNDDGYNDTFRIPAIAEFGLSRILIFDRYGKLLKSGEGSSFAWDGTFLNRDLPSSDYWYHIEIEGMEIIKGHFSLIRN